MTSGGTAMFFNSRAQVEKSLGRKYLVCVQRSFFFLSFREWKPLQHSLKEKRSFSPRMSQLFPEEYCLLG
jgi:hypothetical protein